MKLQMVKKRRILNATMRKQNTYVEKKVLSHTEKYLKDVFKLKKIFDIK